MQRIQWMARAGVAALVVAAGAPAAQAAPTISELLYDAVGADDGKAFVELYGTPGTSLDGLRIQSVNGDNGAVTATLTLTGTIPADGLFVVADRTSAGTTTIANADLLLDFDLQNGPDSLVLRDATSILDAVGYGVFDVGQVFAGEGDPAVDGAAGTSLARFFANVDTDDNAADFGVLAVPTPGTAPLAAVPEPGTAGLLGLGCAALARRRGAG
jgi:PEP-CTERM motif